MELQTVQLTNEGIVTSGNRPSAITIRRSGIAKVHWRKLSVDVPESEIIMNGVNIYAN